MNIKLFTLSVIAFLSISISNLNGQIIEDIHFRVEAGVTASRISNYGSDSESLYSFRAGTTASVPIYFSNFYISTGLLFTQKGEHSTVRYGTIKQTLRPTYLIIPLDLSYKVDINSKGCFYVNAGPYFGVGISGASKNYKYFTNAFSKKGPLRRFQMGIGLSGMVEYRNITVRIGGEIGAIPAVKEGMYPVDQSPRNYQIYLTLGYRLFNWN